MNPPHRRLRAVAFCLPLLIVGMQVAAQLHALEHDGEWLAQRHGVAFVVPAADEVCAICALFAGGAHASPASEQRFVADDIADCRVLAQFATFAGAAPAYYQSRAPPALV